jgi:hypothetical protein
MAPSMSEPLMRHWFKHNGERGIDAVVTQCGDECLGAPAAERRVVDQAVADRRPAGGLDHVCLQ